MSKEAPWTQATPESVVRSYSEFQPTDAIAYESVEQVVMAFKDKMMNTTMHYDAELYLGRPWPWFLNLAITDLPEAALPFVLSALAHYFNGYDELGGVIFPIDQVVSVNEWIIVFGDIHRVDEMAKWPWTFDRPTP